jgi:hypothetical protein
MDWQKWTKTLPFKPEVVQISVATSIDNYSAAGRLMAIWGWVDDNSDDGCNVSGVTPVTVAPLLDRISGVTGFSLAMQNVGWLVVHEDHVEFPNGDRHNGDTAKNRCKTNERVARHRCKGGISRNDNVTPRPLQKALPDKIREDKKNTPYKSPKGDNGAHQRDREIYEAYPRHVGPRKALSAIAAARKRLHGEGKEHPGEFLLAKAKEYAAIRREVEGQPYTHTPHPATWFSQGRYEDDPAQWRVVYNEQRPVVKPPIEQKRGQYND